MKNILRVIALLTFGLATACQGAYQTGGTATAAPGGSAYPAPTAGAVENITGPGYPAPAQTGLPELPAAGGQPPAVHQPAGPGWSIYPPAAEDAQAMTRGEFFVDGAMIVPNQQNAGVFDLEVSGSLPTPCSQVRAEMTGPDQSRQIQVNLYSVMPKDQMCAAVLAPYSGAVVTFAGLESGTYAVILNGQPAGEITIP